MYAGIEPVRGWHCARSRATCMTSSWTRPPRKGMATALMEAALAWVRDRGVPRVVLGTAQQNDVAQRLFERLGFRRTMIEMMREL